MVMFVNGKLSKTEQAEVRRKEQEILAGPGDDTWKSVQIDNLYTSRGLAPGSFDEPGHGQDSVVSYGDSDYSLISVFKFFVGLILFMIIWGWFGRHFPHARDVVFDGFLDFWSLVGTLIFKLWDAL